MAQRVRTPHTSHSLRFASFTLDLHAGELRRNGSRIRLQDQPFQVLALLTRRAGEVVTREELREYLWPADTFVDFDNSLNAAVAKIREALADSPEEPKFIETLPRRGYRFIAKIETPRAKRIPALSAVPSPPRLQWLIAALLLAILLGATGNWFKRRFSRRLTDKDTLVLADFDNGTGDPVFDDTLKQALAVQLQQSPFLNLVPDQQVRETLRFMERSPNELVTGAVAQEICERQGGKVVVQGAIKSLGSHYVLILNAITCNTGASIAEEQVEVATKEQVLQALGGIASRLRGELGESLTLVGKYDTPVAEATTSSLDALRAYSLGVKEQEKGNDAAAIPFFKRAIDLDPNFALAYMRLYIADWLIGEYELGREAAAKAFSLRDRVSEREKLSIQALYHDIVTGDLEKIVEADELWAKTYPREAIPHASLATNYNLIGSYETAIEESKAAIRIAPRATFGYGNLAIAERGLNHWNESRLNFEHLIAMGSDSEAYASLLAVAFAQGDQAATQKYLGLAAGRIQESDTPAFQFNQAEMAAFQGKLRTAREFVDAAVRSADRIGLKQNQSSMLAQESRWEAQLGNRRRAREAAKSAAHRARGIDVELNAALALALGGDPQSAEKMASSLEHSRPNDTVLKTVSVPLLRSTIALEKGDPRRALELLKLSERYELGIGLYYFPALMPTYTRGEAYLRMGDGPRAVVEFQKVLNHRGSGPISLNYVLAQLGLGQANLLVGNVAGARIAYRDFLSLWGDADPEIPILKQARAEYAKLH